jgi:trk system potassium uptake protein TrkH
MANRGANAPFSRRLGFLVVNLLWITLSVTGAIPFYLASLGLDMADALFESVSAVTTTGATVITGLDSAPPGLLLCGAPCCNGSAESALSRSAFSCCRSSRSAASPSSRWNPPTRRRSPSRASRCFVRAFFAIYIGLTLTCAILYRVLGMSDFDAINHAMTTMATGGFSTHDASFGAFPSPALIWTGTVFMAIAGLPFSVLILFAVRGRLDALRDPQIFAYAASCSCFPSC